MEPGLGLRTIARHRTFMNALKLHSFRQPLHKKIINTREHSTVCGIHIGGCKNVVHWHVISFISIILSRFGETTSFASIFTAEERARGP
jgi:hypothetical protein